MGKTSESKTPAQMAAEAQSRRASPGPTSPAKLPPSAEKADLILKVRDL